MIAYKVLYKETNDRLFSSNYGNNLSGLEQEYFLDKENFPKFNYPIFCFQYFCAAEDFANSEPYFGFGKFVIYEVEGEDVPLTKMLSINHKIEEDENVLKKVEDAILGFAKIPPHGTIGMKSIKFLKEIN